MGKQGELPIHILKQNLKSTTCNGDEHNEQRAHRKIINMVKYNGM